MSKVMSVTAAAAVFGTYGLEAVNEELVARNLPRVEDASLGCFVLASGVRSMQEFTATVTNLSKATVTGKEMTPLLQRAFPQHNVGDRHGPHYLSLCRTGDSGNVVVRYAPEKGGRKAAPAKPLTVDLSTVEAKKLAAIRKAVAGTPLEAVVEASLAAKVEEPAAQPEAPEQQPAA
jgi:hypothetical protein